MLLIEGFVFGGCRLDHKRVLVPTSWQAEDVSGLCPDSVAHEPFRSSRKRINFIGFFSCVVGLFLGTHKSCTLRYIL